MDRNPAVPGDFRADLVRWQQLVSPAWLKAMVTGQSVAAAPAEAWQLIEVACDGLDAYFGGHIPGSRYLDTRQCEQLPFWNAVPDAQLQRAWMQAGIRSASTVILYGRNPLAAARVALLLLYAGVRDVRLLDGGFAAWCAAGHALQRGGFEPPTAPEPPTVWGAAFPARPDYLINTQAARQMLSTPGCALVSIRSRAEFDGETSGYSYIAAHGEIAGALWGHAGRDGDVNDMGSLQTSDGRMRPASEIAALWAAAGIHPGLHIAFYCGTGWRAALAFFYAWLMGWEHIGVYDGGWMEWSSDSANPVICRSPARL